MVALESSVAKLSSAVEINKSTPFPSLDAMFGQGTTTDYQIFPIRPELLYEASRNSNELQIVFFHLKREIFRNGFEFKPKWLSKCQQCDKEFEFETEYCDSCDFQTRPPDFTEIKSLKEFFKRVNNNGNTFEEIMEQCEDDLQTADACYMVLVKDYLSSSDGTIISGKIKEIFRGSPVIFSRISDTKGRLGYNSSGFKVMICPDHRETPHYIKEGDSTKPCPSCGCRLYNSKFKSRDRLGGGQGIYGEHYYIDGEVLYANKYFTGISGGYSPLVAVWDKVQALRAMDFYVKEYYGKQRPPKGLLFVDTKNVEELKKTWEWIEKQTRGNPHLIHPIAVQSNKGRGNVAQFINFMNNLNEAQYVEVRREFTAKIGARFGVMPLFQGDLSTSGGMNQEGLQITVTNRAVATGQTVWNTKLFPYLLQQYGIDDFILELNPSEEQDETAETDRMIKKVQVAQMMMGMGFDVDLSEDGESFKFSGEAKKPMEALDFDEDLSAPAPRSTAQRFEGSPPLTKAKMPSFVARPVKSKLVREFEQLFSKLRYRRKPSERQVKELVSKLSGISAGKMKRSLEKQVKDIYTQGIRDVAKDTGVKIGFGQVDQNAVSLIKKDRTFSSAFQNVSKTNKKRLVEDIEKFYEEPTSLGDLVQTLSKTVDGSEGKLNTIARTESHRISTIARSNSYFKADPKGAFKFQWIGPSDNRTTDICKELERKTINGVSKSVLKNLIGDVAKKHGSKARDFTPHINCRHTFVKFLPSINKGYYDGKLETFGDSAQAVGWNKSEDQQKRFEQLMQVFDGEESSVLDIGAGLGEFYFAMMKFFPGNKYIGLEKERDFIKRVQDRGTGPFELIEGDFFKRDFVKGGYDYLIASGTFNEDNADLLKAIPKMWACANKGIAFNFLYKGDYNVLKTYDKEKVVKLVESLGGIVTVGPGAIENELTVLVKKQ